MDFKVVLSQAALNDLGEIVRFVAADDPAAAERLGMRLLDQAETLSRLPRRGGAVRQRPGVRKVLLRPYIIFYRIDERARGVEVLRFWHASRDEGKMRLG